MKTYQLVRVRTRNSLGWFATEDEALEEVAEFVHRVGRRRADGIALYHTDNHDDTLIAQDAELIKRTLERFPLRKTA